MLNLISRLHLLTGLLILNASCLAQGNKATNWRLIDKQATTETQNLYRNLQQVSKDGVLFGQQDILSNGVNWNNEPGRSDLKEITGEYPAVFGWDLGKVEVGSRKNFDSVPLDRIRDYIRQAYRMGGINTLCWHANNPVNPLEGVRYKKVDSTIHKMFADPLIMNRYRSWLDTIAHFAGSLKGKHGELIPFIFRPFHEHNGNWFWWGKSHCTPDEYKKLWRYTVDYLKNKKQVHNIIYAYSTDQFWSREEYLERYPGDAYVDILGFDGYDKPENHPGTKFQTSARKMVETLRDIGKEKKKIWAFTETGLKLVPQADWWTGTLLPIIKDSGLSYVLVWRNGSPKSYWGTFPGQISAEDFKHFHENPAVLFQKKAAARNIYK